MGSHNKWHAGNLMCQAGHKSLGQDPVGMDDIRLVCLDQLGQRKEFSQDKKRHQQEKKTVLFQGWQDAFGAGKDFKTFQKISETVYLDTFHDFICQRTRVTG